jgi:hypothetical protein
MNTKQRLKMEQLETALDVARSENIRLQKVPDQIWKSAIELAREVGVGPVARILRLNHTRLKNFVDGSAVSLQATPSVPTFLELQPSRSTTSISCSIEIEASGGVMRARLDGIAPVDLGLLFRAYGS